MDTQPDQLIAMLRRAAGLLDNASTHLRADILTTCDRLQHPTCRVAVFGPFNYGKSTLLNALLGEKTLPMDLVPTTGAAITVKYGPDSKTCITHTDGTIQEETGTEGLQQYAVLDEQRRMRADVAAVEVYAPHPLLKLGIELIDLPGTDDTIAQNELVQQQLLGADVVIQLLDGRKLMTLAERENLRDWLLDRGIETVIFVVNFLNLMEERDRQQVALRLRFLAESFRATLPTGVSNLYQVDALPALRARLKGDAAAAAQTGLSELESALQTIGQQFQSGRPSAQILPRLNVLSSSVIAALTQQVQQLSIIPVDEKITQKLEIKQKAQRLIYQGFEQDIAKLRAWLSVSNLQANYRLGLAEALAQTTTQKWLSATLQPAWEMRKQPVENWVNQASEFFDCARPAKMQLGFSMEPAIAQETAPAGDSVPAGDSASEETEQQLPKMPLEAGEGKGIGPVAIATGLGWILGGPLGAAVLGGTSHLVNESNREKKAPVGPTPTPVVSTPTTNYPQQADVYLARFSAAALEALDTYATQATQIIQTPLSAPQAQPSAAHTAQISLLQATINDLNDLRADLA